MLLCLLNGQLHRIDTEGLSHGIVAFDGGSQGCFPDDLGLGIQLDHALGDFLMITDQALNTVGFNAAQVCIQQNIGDLGAFLLGKAVTLKHLDAEVSGFNIGNMMVLHGAPP